MVRLNAKQLRAGQVKSKKLKVKKNDIYIVLDNVLDTYNIGSIFRLADAVAAKKIYLCGGTETPPNHRIKKASINTTQVVDWEYCESATQAIAKVRQLTSEVSHKVSSRSHLGGVQSVQVVAIEQTATAVPYDKFEYKLPICLVVGHETEGISTEVLEIVDGVVELPMFGINKSLNVVVSLAIVLYKVVEGKQS